jgi:4-amino-4-deoxy-L-arabinose transferase-like glycosyltransferase
MPDSENVSKTASESRFTSGPAIVAYLALFKLILHLTMAGMYGLFVDELYFLACGEHLAWGYVDMPPLTAFQAWLTRALFGDSMLSIRLFPALAGAGLVLLTGAIVRALDGKRFAQGLAALAVVVSPAYLLMSTYLSMNSIEPLLWMGCALVLIRLIKTGNTRLWLWFGLIAGLGLLNKHTMLLFGFALIFSLLFVAPRRLMANRWFFIGGGIAFLIFLPNLIWMIQHHFPFLELQANIRRSHRNVDLSPLEFIGQQILLLMHPATFPIWLAGLASFLFGRQRKQYCLLGSAYLVTLGVLLLVNGRVYYLMPAYPMLLAGGAAVMEFWLTRPGWRWVRMAYPALIAVAGTITAPMAMPLLQPETYIRYTQALGFKVPQIEHRRSSQLPQLFADRFGWPEMVAGVAKVYHALPAEDQAKAAIFGNNYGECGAIDFYGPKQGLPKAIGAHQNYWYWGPRDFTGEVMIVLGEGRRERLEQYYSSVTEAARVEHPYSMASENFTIYLCRGLKHPLKEIWPGLKNWN